MNAILAHQGGWDEILMVLGPIALIVGLLRLAKRRTAERRQAEVDRRDQPATREMSAPNETSRPTRSS